MKTLQLAVVALVMTAAAPALGQSQSITITTGAWSPSKASARVATAPSGAVPTPITTGAWAPSKPTVRQASTTTKPLPITTGQVAPSKLSALRAAGR